MSSRKKAPASHTATTNRRDFLKTGALTALFMGTGLPLAHGRTAGWGERLQRIEPGSAKNIVFLVSDGMSTGTLNMTDLALNRFYGRPSNWMELYRTNKVRRSLMDMASADHIVTDSSAASSSWGCGRRINNGGVNWGPNAEEYKPILPIFRDAGKATGLVTTTEITHATPAGFVANVEGRWAAERIAEQYLEREVDVLLGGGNGHYHAERRSDGRDLYADYRQAGYQVARSKDELNAVQSSEGRLLGVFANGHLPYTLDQNASMELRAQVPTLADLTRVALERLDRHNNGFILQIEGGRVDHAAHGNDIGGIIHDQIAFDNAIGAVLEFTENRDDTLVIVTTDHGNANPGLNGGPDHMFDRIQRFTQTGSWIGSQLENQSSISTIKDAFHVATRLEITDAQARFYQKARQGEHQSPYAHLAHSTSVLGHIIAEHTNVNFTGRSHTADYVELAAYGPGSEAIDGSVANTELFDLMVSAAGVGAFTEW